MNTETTIKKKLQEALGGIADESTRKKLLNGAFGYVVSSKLALWVKIAIGAAVGAVATYLSTLNL